MYEILYLLSEIYMHLFAEIVLLYIIYGVIKKRGPISALITYISLFTGVFIYIVEKVLKAYNMLNNINSKYIFYSSTIFTAVALIFGIYSSLKYSDIENRDTVKIGLTIVIISVILLAAYWVFKHMQMG